MKIMDGLKTLELKLEQELREFFIILGESEAPESWPEATHLPRDSQTGPAKHAAHH